MRKKRSLSSSSLPLFLLTMSNNSIVNARKIDYFCTLSKLDTIMTGQMYSSSEYAINAFRAKNLFNKAIVCNESNPTEKDFDSLSEIYKVLWMAEYYLWEEIGSIQIIPLKSSFTSLFTNSSFLTFKVYLKNDDFLNSDIWIIETNAPSLRLAPLIDLLAQKVTEMGHRYVSFHGNSTADYLWTKRAGTLNRLMPLFHSSLYGEWIAADYEEVYYITNRESIENELSEPSFTLNFYGSNGCSLGGNHPIAIQATGIYDSNYNIIVDISFNRVLAFVVSLDDKELKVVHRYKNNYSGRLVKKDDYELVVATYRRVSELKRAIDY